MPWISFTTYPNSFSSFLAEGKNIRIAESKYPQIILHPSTNTICLSQSPSLSPLLSFSTFILTGGVGHELLPSRVERPQSGRLLDHFAFHLKKRILLHAAYSQGQTTKWEREREKRKMRTDNKSCVVSLTKRRVLSHAPANKKWGLKRRKRGGFERA
jgi:hypothetical protein